jgi:hypothetical protein
VFGSGKTVPAAAESLAVDGDGTGDRLLATGVADGAPAWRAGQPDGPYELAHIAAGGRVVARDAGTGQILWSAAPGRDRGC